MQTTVRESTGRPLTLAPWMGLPQQKSRRQATEPSQLEVEHTERCTGESCNPTDQGSLSPRQGKCFILSEFIFKLLQRGRHSIFFILQHKTLIFFLLEQLPKEKSYMNHCFETQEAVFLQICLLFSLRLRYYLTLIQLI